MTSDSKLIFEAYTKSLDEGIVGRTAARLGGLGASVTQPFKNIGAGIKSVGQLATGNVAGAQQTMAGVKTSAQAAFDSKVKSITGQYIKKITDDLVKLGLVTPDKVQSISNAVNTAIASLVTPALTTAQQPAQQPAPTAQQPAPTAQQPAPTAQSTKLVSKTPSVARGAGGISKNELNKILGGGVVKKGNTSKKVYR